MITDGGREAVNTEIAKKALAARQPTGMLPATIFIILLSGLVYVPSIRGLMIWDDTELLSGKGLGSPTSIPACFKAPFLFHYYRPLTSATFILDHRIWDHGVWGSNTLGYHFTNLLLHMLTTALLIPVLLQAFRSWPNALFGALMFAVQPAQVSAVAWIGGRTDSLCTFFIATFFLVVISAARSSGVKRVLLLAVSLFCFSLAALAKEQALFLLPLAPAAIVVFGGAPENRKAISKEIALWTVLFTFVALCLLAAWMRFGDPLHPHWNLGHQLRLVGPTIDYYTLLLLAPTLGLNHEMTLNSMMKLGIPGAAAGLVIAILAIALLIRLVRTDPVAAWFFGGALLLLVPVSNLYPMTTQTVAPYRSATAGLCVAAVIGWAFVRLMDKGKSAAFLKNKPQLVALPIGIYAVWLCCLTFKDDHTWVNSLAASREVERYDPGSVFGALETANAYLEFGSFEPAVARLDRVTRNLPDTPDNRTHSEMVASWNSTSNISDWAASLYGRAGILKLNEGDRQSAISVLNKGMLLSPQNEHVNAGLANYALAINDYVGGEAPIRIVLAHQPELTGLRVRFARILYQQKRWQEANSQFTICQSQAPTDISLYLFTAQARIKCGNHNGAAELLSDGLKRHVLQNRELQAWLKSIGEPDLLHARGI